MQNVEQEITFFERFEHDILAQKKTITIRDETESHFPIGPKIRVATFEEGREFCHIEITSVEAIEFEQLSDFHAQQENMTLPELKAVIHNIYPGIKQLFVLSFKLL